MEWKNEAQFVELVAFCILMASPGVESELKRHAAANMRLGNSRELLKQIIEVGTPYLGEDRIRTVRACIDSIAQVE